MAEEKIYLEQKKENLLALVSTYLSENEVKKVNDALELLQKECKDNRHTDGSLFVLHPIDVAIGVAEQLKLGVTSIVVALLHSLPNTCDYPIENIRKDFGNTVADLIEGFQQISKIHIEKPSLYSDNFRNLLLSLIKDIRIILIKLIDRVYMLRSMEGISFKEQQKICEETFYLYAPLAHRLGLYAMKTELEDNAMKYSHREKFDSITRSLKESKNKREAYIKSFIEPIRKELLAHGFKFEIKGRSKSVHSIWQKMIKQKVGFEKVYDVFAIRIILDNIIDDEKADCWKVYSILTNKYQPNPKRLRDWVTVPKSSSGYESLHTTVLGPQERWVEVQIRTRRMDDVAEKGQAAHWKYKEGATKENTDELRLKSIREILEKPEDSELEETEDVKVDLYADTIFVFTPDRELKKLSAGSTVLDFAFQVHTRVGEQCTGAIVDGKNVPIRYPLKNGETVKILTSKNQRPAADWIHYVSSIRTKTKIRRALRAMEYRNVDMGKDTLLRKLNQLKHAYDDEVVNRLLKHFKLKTSQDLYEGIGAEKIDISGLKKILVPDEEVKEAAESEKVMPQLKRSSIADNKDVLLIDNESINSYKMANCCKPVFGDSIFGFITIGQGVKIHRTSCPNAKQLRERYPYRIIEAQWYNKTEESDYLSELRITGSDELGIIRKITDVISDDIRLNMHAINFSSKQGVFTGNVTLHVRDNNVLQSLIYKLRKIKQVDRVSRIR